MHDICSMTAENCSPFAPLTLSRPLSCTGCCIIEKLVLDISMLWISNLWRCLMLLSQAEVRQELVAAGLAPSPHQPQGWPLQFSGILHLTAWASAICSCELLSVCLQGYVVSILWLYADCLMMSACRLDECVCTYWFTMNR